MAAKQQRPSVAEDYNRRISQEALRQYQEGTKIWYQDEEDEWVAAEIKSSNNSHYQIELTNGNTSEIAKFDVKGPTVILLQNEEVMGDEGLMMEDDLAKLQHLHEPALIHALRERFDVDKIYTFTGPIVISVNPFKRIGDMYSDAMLGSYITEGPPDYPKPHAYSIGYAAYHGMCTAQKSQTVLVSGESGAGKTEATKVVMKFLAKIGAGGDVGGLSSIEEKVLQSNPLLEAFGNAKTLRNNNSSRYGKFIELHFDQNPKLKQQAKDGCFDARQGGSRLQGAMVDTYMLEEVRVQDQLEGERNYHVFYQACAAATKIGGGVYKSADGKIEVDVTGFEQSTTYNYLLKSSIHEIPGMDDIEELEITVGAMNTIGVDQDTINNIFKGLATCLNMGNIEFSSPDNETSVIKDKKWVTIAAELLGVDAAALETSLVKRSMKVAGSDIIKDNNEQKAGDTRDTLARVLYGLQFLLIKDLANKATNINKSKDPLVCGVLDIFGFECFKQNSFEQLCINFTNERLQQFFNTFIFKQEEKLYKAEGIEWSALDFPDNQDCIDMLSGKGSVFAILDEEGVVPGGSDKGFVSKISKCHKDHIRFDIIKTKQTWFVINHYAGPVPYDSAYFLDKNKNLLSMDCVNVLQKSSHKYFVDLFAPCMESEAKPQPGKKVKLKTVSGKFCEQLTNLMNVVGLTDPHFIRCIKATPKNKPDIYEGKYVAEQLRYGGVLQAIQVQRAGYPVRISPEEIYRDFKGLGSLKIQNENQGKPGKDAAEALLTSLEHLVPKRQKKNGIESVMWSVGKTLVFLKQPVFEALQAAMLTRKNTAAVKVQAKYKAKLGRRRFENTKIQIVKCQALMRGRLSRKKCMKMKQNKNAKKLQRWWRMIRVRKVYLRQRFLIIKVQARIRGHLNRSFTKFTPQILKLQTWYRMIRKRRAFALLKKGADMLQGKIRVRMAKAELKRLKVAAVETKRKEEEERLRKEAEERKAEEERRRQEHEESERIREAELEVLRVTAASNSEKARIAELEMQQKTEAMKLEHEEQQAAARQEAADQAKAEQEVFQKKQDELIAQMEEKTRKMEERMTGQIAEEAKVLCSKNSVLKTTLLMQRALKKEQGDKLKAQITEKEAAQANIGSQLYKLCQEVAEEVQEEGFELKNNAANLDDQTANVKALFELLRARVKIERQEKVTERRAKDALQRKFDMQTERVDQLSGQYAKLLANAAQVSKFIDKAKLVGLGEDRASNKCVDVALMGGAHVGKSDLMEALLLDVKKDHVPAFKAIRKQIMTHTEVTIDGQELHIRDCSGNPDAQHIVKDLYKQSVFIILVYDLASQASLDIALAALPEAIEAGALVLLFGHQRNDAPLVANIELALTEVSKESNARCIQGSQLKDAVRLCMNWGIEALIEKSAEAGSALKIQTNINQQNLRTKTISMAQEKAPATVLLPSMPKITRGRDQLLTPVRVVAEKSLGDPITAMAFGKKIFKNYSMLVIGQRDGKITVFRCNNTPMERELAVDAPEECAATSAGEVLVQAECTSQPHTSAITSLTFNPMETDIISASLDKSVRWWNVATGELNKIFTNTVGVSAAIFMPLNPEILVSADSEKKIRLVHCRTGSSIQKLKLPDCGTRLIFDDQCMSMICGSNKGKLHLLRCKTMDSMEYCNEGSLTIGEKMINEIIFVPGTEEQGPAIENPTSLRSTVRAKTLSARQKTLQNLKDHASAPTQLPPYLLVNMNDDCVIIVDLQYQAGKIKNMSVRHRCKVANRQLPLRGCYSKSGYMVTGSEDKDIYVYSMDPQNNYALEKYQHHDRPVTCCAVNPLDTLLVSGDSQGKVAFWRRYDK